MERDAAGEEVVVCLNETQSGDILLCKLSLWVTLGACQPNASDTLYTVTATIRFSIISAQRSVQEVDKTCSFIYSLSMMCFVAACIMHLNL